MYGGQVNGVYTPHWRSLAVLAKVSANPIRYERRLRDGAVEVFAQSDGVITAGRRVYLTDIIDPQGLSLHFTYDASLRLVAVTDAIGLVTTLSYEWSSDPTKITKVTDPYGRFATLTYNPNGELASITDVIGMTSSFVYGPSDFIVSMTTPYGTTLFAHEGGALDTDYSRFIQATDPLGGTERVEFRWSTTAIAAAAPSGQVPTGFTASNTNLDHYNSLYWDKRAMALSPGDVSTATITHWLLYTFVSYTPIYYSHAFSTSIPHSVKRPLENRVWYAYPDQGTSVNAVGSWRGPTQVARVLDDGTSQIQQATYNTRGYPTTLTDPLGRRQSLTYATNGIDLLEVRQTTGALNDLLAAFSNYTATHRPQTVVDAAGQTTTASYNAAGQVLTVTNAKSETTTLAYDANGYLQSVTGAITGATTTYTYDSYGRPRTVTESDGYALTTDYDALDRPTRVTYPDGTHEDNVYSRLDVEQQKDRLGRTTRFFYDAAGRLTAMRDPLGRTVVQQWCACGVMEKLIDGKGQATTWERDAQSRVTREVRADGTTATVYAYETTTSRLKTVTDPKGQITTSTYNADDSLAQTVYTNAEHATPSVSFTYDPSYARVASMIDGTGTTVYTYKGLGALGALRTASVDGPLANDTITYDYDELGRAVGRAINGVGVTLAYDALGRLTSEANVLGTFGYTYVGQTGRIDTVTYPNAQSTTYSYFGNSGDRRLQTIHHRKPNASTLSKFDYSYDAVGNILSWVQQADAAAPTAYQFAYDAADQLITAVKQTTDPTPTILKRYAYGYDAAANRTSEQIDDAITNASHNALNRLTSRTVGGALRFAGTVNEPATVTIQGKPAVVTASNGFSGTALVSTGTTTVTISATDGSGNQSTAVYEVDEGGAGSTLTYDANGNLTSDGSRTFEWDGTDRQVAVNVGTHRSEFSYDGFSRRVGIIEKDGGTTTSDTRFVWCGLALCEARDAATGSVVKRYFDEGVQDGGTAYFYTRDHLGSVRELVDGSNVVRARYDYDPWGRRTKLSGDKDADVGYTGHYQHVPSALTLAPFRAYDGSLGRWISEDPSGLADGPNPYRYATNAPVTFVDPDGKQATTAPGIWLGGLIGGPPGAVVGGLIGAGLGLAIGDALWNYYFNQKPPKDAYDPKGPKAPGKPTEADGFKDPEGAARTG